MAGGNPDRSSRDAFLRALAIFLYFVVATVWLPDKALSLVNSSSWLVQDLVVLGVWGTALFGGMFGLRWAQQRGLI